MNYYKGIVPGIDEPKNSGSYVKETLDAHEKYNFMPAHIIDSRYPEGDYCLGFVETKVDDVLVIFVHYILIHLTKKLMLLAGIRMQLYIGVMKQWRLITSIGQI